MLYPTFQAPDAMSPNADLAVTEQPETIETGITPRAVQRAIELDAIGRPVMTDPAEAYYQKMVAELKTEQGKYMAMPPSFGIKLQDIMHSDFDNEIRVAEIERRVKDTVDADPRTNSSSVQAQEQSGDEIKIDIQADTIFGQVSIPLRIGGDYE